MVKNDWFAIQPTQNERGRQKVRPPAKQYLSLFAYFFSKGISLSMRRHDILQIMIKMLEFVSENCIHLPKIAFFSNNLNTKVRLSGSFSHLIHLVNPFVNTDLSSSQKSCVTFYQKKEHTLRNKAKKKSYGKVIEPF